MNQSEALDSQIRERRGELHAIIMDLRNTCLDARSELYKTRDVVGETDKIIKAHDRAMSELETLIKAEQSALLNRIEEAVSDKSREIHVGGHKFLKLEEVKQILHKEREKL